MQLVQEEYFPRGGKPAQKPPDNQKRKFPKQESLFSFNQDQNKPSKKQAKKKAAANKKEKLQKDKSIEALAEPQLLAHTTIKEDMLILGNVRHVSAVAVQVELPGRIYGYISIASVSDVLTERLKKQLMGENREEQQELILQNFFEVGEFLPVKVVKVENVEKGVRVSLTTKPAIVNADLNHTAFRKEMLLWATVAEQLEHGYRLDVGVQNVRIFLQNEKVPEGTEFKMGQNIWCVVHTCNIAPSATTLKVSALPKHIESSIENDHERSLHSVLPGMQFAIDITEIMKNGLLCQFLSHQQCYVHQTYLQKPLQGPNEFKEGQEVRGRILYIQPITKMVFFTLRGLGAVSVPQLKIGDIVSARVLGHGSGGVFLKLSDSLKGFVTLKRILNSLNTSNEENIVDLVKEKYPKGKKVTCRILDYNRLDSVYVCTVEASVLMETLFTRDDLVMGQLVDARIKQINNRGFVVKFGNLEGFVDNLHISNAQFSENIKSKFRVGQTLKARVLCINQSGSIRLTLKPALVESDECLSTADQAVIGKQFPGVVVMRNHSGALVVFYGDLTGFIRSRNLLPGQEADARDLLFDGQVVTVTIVGKGNKGINLSLVPKIKEEENGKQDRKDKEKKKQSKRRPLDIGEDVSGKIVMVEDSGMQISVSAKNLVAFLPLHHLSVNYDLNPILMKTYTVGEQFNNLLCVSLKDKPILSLRESIAYSKQNLSIPDTLKPGQLLRGSYVSKDDGGMKCEFPVKGGTRILHMPKNELGDGNNLEFVDQQGLVAKVVTAGRKTKLTAKLTEVFDYTVDPSLQILEQYLSNIQRISMHFSESGHPLGKYNIGQRVCCLVKKLKKKGGCSVILEDEVEGFVDAQHCGEDITQGQTVSGVVLWVDYVRKRVEITLQPKIMSKINEVQDSIINEPFVSTASANILLIKKNFALCSCSIKRQLVFLPTKVHENDFETLAERYKSMIGNKTKILLYKKVAGRLVGFVQTLADELTRTAKRSVETEEVVSKKLKLEKPSQGAQETEIVNDQSVKNEHDILNGVEQESTTAVKRKSEETAADSPRKKSKSDSKIDITYPGMADFFATDDSTKEENSSSDDEAVNKPENTKKKKKLTPAERAELAKQEEERIRRIENELADPSTVPESAEQFDRLVLAHPNSSKIWAQYIAFHLSTAEVEKARTVVKRALNTIHIDKVQDKLNIWIAYLNLENMFGTKESFERVFEEATKYNEPYSIYVEAIHMLAETKKFDEFEDKMRKFRGKFKSMSKTWIEMARAYFELSRFEEARKLKEGALKSITDKKQHIDVLVQFAIMEFKYGEQNQGEVLFETILSSYPGRVDVWNSYVDQLVKKQCIDSARRVLERATTQRLSLMKMRSLFKKFRDFEKLHGTEESLQQVKDALVEYVARVKGGVDK